MLPVDSEAQWDAKCRKTDNGKKDTGKIFDLTPRRIYTGWDLLRPSSQEDHDYGHFGTRRFGGELDMRIWITI